MPTIAELLLARADDRTPGLVHDEQRWTWAEVVAASADRAAFLAERLDHGAPLHVGVLLENVPEFVFWLGGAALAGATVVGINPTRRGAELARDITHTRCQLVVTDQTSGPLLDGLDLGGAEVIDRTRGDRVLPRSSGAMPLQLGHGVTESTLFLLLFTSGTSGAPKAVRCSQGRLAGIGTIVAQMFELTSDDVCYAAMPLFHSNALMAGWAPALAAGATVVLRRRFSASAFLPDVRRHGVTYVNYVGRPLSYILATEARGDDADNPLRQAFGNEASQQDIERFARRFGCAVTDGYGSTEGGANVQRTPDMPAGALGRAGEGTVVIDPQTGHECPPARFDDGGILLNPGEAIGELVNKHGAAGFEGYWDNAEATEARLRDGWYWTGDLAYRDADGFFFFAGRNADWMRVDGENFAGAPIERILARHPDVVLGAVYGVPDPTVGDQVMAAVQLRPGATFEPEAFSVFLAGQQDLGTKWSPRFVRVMEALPVTETNKILKRHLQADGWEVTDPVWWRPGRDDIHRRLTADDRAALAQALAEAGRRAALRTAG